MQNQSVLARRLGRRTVLRSLPLLPLLSHASLPLNALFRQASTRVPFLERVTLSPGELVGSGLNGRRVFDLSRLIDDGLRVENEDFFVRTRAPEGVMRAVDDGSVRFDAGAEASGHFRDFGGSVTEISARELVERSRSMGLHLIECSGNSSRRGFGLIGVAEWSGVLLTDLFASAFGNTSARMLVRISGNDEHAEESRSSVPGASWIFTVEQIRQTGAFLATGMNGQRLPLDHGAPVRLIVPGWYGCTSIKWVESVEVVAFDTPATSQMLEFATRTHQSGRPELARDYLPATLDFAAMPIAVDGPDSGGGFRIHGIAWGDPDGVETLEIRCASAEPSAEGGAWFRVEDFIVPARSSWSLWRHRFQPRQQGEVEIALRVGSPGELGEPSVRTRRLDTGYYNRRVQV